MTFLQRDNTIQSKWVFNRAVKEETRLSMMVAVREPFETVGCSMKKDSLGFAETVALLTERK